jgi:hypothetical protein
MLREKEIEFCQKVLAQLLSDSILLKAAFGVAVEEKRKQWGDRDEEPREGKRF